MPFFKLKTAEQIKLSHQEILFCWALALLGSVENAECGVRRAECGVWKVRSMESAECGKRWAWKVRSVESAECGKRRVWKMRIVESAECGKCGVWKMRSVEIVECEKCVESAENEALCMRSLNAVMIFELEVARFTQVLETGTVEVLEDRSFFFSFFFYWVVICNQNIIKLCANVLTLVFFMICQLNCWRILVSRVYFCCFPWLVGN